MCSTGNNGEHARADVDYGWSLEAGTVGAWKAPVSHRAHDAAKSWDANGDVDHESQEANKAILQTTVRFLELTTRMVSDPHVKRMATSKTPPLRVSASFCPVGHLPLLRVFLFTHVPPLR